jgi:HD-like signal output (HDOD) protein
MAKPAEPNGGQPPVGPLYPELSLEPPPPPLPAAPREPRAAGEWIAHIREQDMPALGATVALVHAVTGDDRASTDRLAQVILQDAAMTTKVLKLANSAFYNPARQGVSTISRAIVVLGFNTVAEIAIGIRLVDALLAGGVRQRVIDEMAQSFHAAVQARAIAALRHDKRSEEVFIAALLSRVGEMAFWCFGGQTAVRLDKHMQSSEQTAEEAQMTVLGFRLRQLSVGLARDWKLGALLQSVLESGARAGPAEQAIRLGQRLAAELENGWDAPGARRLVSELAGFVGLPEPELRAQLAASSREAARIACYFGADEAARCIPLAGWAEVEPDTEPELVEACPVPSEPDPRLQLRILRELSGRIAQGANLNEVLQLVLEGIYRGVGFDRVLFALLTANRQQLVGKTCLGAGGEALRQRFIFSLDNTPGDLFNEFFRKPRALRIEPGRATPGVRVDRLQLVTNAELACIAPILVQGRAIGMFYADRLDAGRGIDDESFEAVQLFAQQVSLAVTTGASGVRAP